MFNFLFWNVGRRDIRQLIAEAAIAVDADCLVLCECTLEPSQVIESLNQHAPDYRYAFGECQDLMFFTKFEAEFLVPRFENSRISIRQLVLPAKEDLLIVGAHLPSRLYFSGESLVQECFVLARFIEQEEQRVGHKRTVLLGDLNVNPFESGMVGTGGLHAMMAQDIALRGYRTVQGRRYDFFYNPMWSHFGDRASSPPGTYYYERAEAVNYFWNMYHQVLIRPELLEKFNSVNLRILTKAGPSNLLDGTGRPDKINASDHLPIAFGLNL